MRLCALPGNTQRLDGGAMFGNVPRALWSRFHGPDEENRILLDLRVLLVEDGERCVLVDTGAGHQWSEKECSMFATRAGPEPDVVAALRRAGRGPEDVTDVVLTHLHFDHAGGVTRRDASRGSVPTFPRATVHLQRANLETARRPNERERRSYLRHHWQPLLDEGRLRLLDGPGEVMPGIDVEVSEGHTTGLQVVHVQGEQGRFLYPADVVPLTTHVSVPWTMGYDLCPRTLMDEKRQLLGRAVDEGLVVVFEHDPAVAAARVESEDGRFRAGEPVALEDAGAGAG